MIEGINKSKNLIILMLAMIPVSDATLIGHWAFDEGAG